MTENISTAPSKPKRYHPALVSLHWIVALLIFATALLAMGGEGEGRFGGGPSLAGIPILGIHMILGITVLVLLVIRLVIRLRSRRPDWATTGSGFLDRVGEITHWALYFFTFAITITGLVLVLQTNRLARAFNLGGAQPRQSASGGFQPGEFPPGGGLQPGGQFQPGQTPPPRGEGRFPEGGRFFLGAFHGLSWTLLLLLILLHVGAALYHQFFIRDDLLGRMWFGKRYG